MHKKVSTDMDFVSREKDVLTYWKETDVFNKTIKNREGCEVFTFYDGPPTANGKPHIGHILTRVIKDIIPRYKTMKGYKVLRKAGWDTHGLPVELEVEKSLGLDGKPDIEKYGVEPFIKRCKESVWKYKKDWELMSERVGYWADMDDPYITYDNTYIESIWWSLKRIWDDGLIYKGQRVIPYCPRCGTSLSSHEVAQGYKDTTDTTIIVKFPVRNTSNEYILAWTTTPWTLPSNLALCVNPDESYSRIRVGDDLYIIATGLISEVIGDSYEIINEYKGKDLFGIKYEPLFDFASHISKDEAWHVVCDDFVTLADGTGIVHIAPAFGEDDSRVGSKEKLPHLQLVDEQGRMTKETDFLKGLFVKDADPVIIKALKEKGLLLKEQKFEHSYPYCWRCDTSLIYYARSAWFIKTTQVREKLIENNKKINWIPDNIKNGRFGNFLENNVDWSLSRERYWGTPLPIWECGCGYRTAIGSIKELYEKAIDIRKDIELHKPYIDEVHLRCDVCGGRMKRVEEVIDCWYDSGAMPFAQWHYPFKNKGIFKENFPADFISEAIDQTRGWFYTLHAVSTLVFDSPAYKNVIVLGLVQDKDGQKMSKHKGNVVDPWEVLNKQGADAIRWYFYSVSSPWLPSRFSEEAVSEVQRKFIGTLWNTYAFYVLYANIDKFIPQKYDLDHDKLEVIDKWIISRLNSLIKKVDSDLNAYKITESAREIAGFTDDLSNWYVRRNRERFWDKEMSRSKISAYLTLYKVLTELSLLIAPFIPFTAEMIYDNLVTAIDPKARESVHLCDYPTYDEKLIDKELEDNMQLALEIVISGRTLRNISGLKNRQPLRRMMVRTPFVLPEGFVDLIKDELNIKELEFTDKADSFTNYTYKPQLKTLGPRYGKLLPGIKKHLEEADGSVIRGSLEKGHDYEFDLNGTRISLGADDLIEGVTHKQGYVSEITPRLAAVLDTALTPVLVEEGFVREIISKIQMMRKDAGFEVQDHIYLSYNGNELIKDIIEKNSEVIADETLSDKIDDSFENAFTKEWDINGEKVTMGVKKAVG